MHAHDFFLGGGGGGGGGGGSEIGPGKSEKHTIKINWYEQ